MKYRHELKHEITTLELLTLRTRLKAVASPDQNAIGGRYVIDSLYFDTAADKALREKLDGVNVREKFRIRFYNGDTSFIRLEKKSKINGLCAKQSAPVTKEQVRSLLDGDAAWMVQSDDALIRELYTKMRSGLMPKAIVSYTREPFVFPAGNVRVTLDYDIRSSLDCRSFLDPGRISLPAGGDSIVLEVKWDEFLPDVIRDTVQLPDCRSTAFSKYAVSRIYG